MFKTRLLSGIVLVIILIATVIWELLYIMEFYIPDRCSM